MGIMGVPAVSKNRSYKEKQTGAVSLCPLFTKLCLSFCRVGSHFLLGVTVLCSIMKSKIAEMPRLSSLFAGCVFFTRPF